MVRYCQKQNVKIFVPVQLFDTKPDRYAYIIADFDVKLSVLLLVLCICIPETIGLKRQGLAFESEKL